jgi:hypothetical protein
MRRSEQLGEAWFEKYHTHESELNTEKDRAHIIVGVKPDWLPKIFQVKAGLEHRTMLVDFVDEAQGNIVGRINQISMMDLYHEPGVSTVLKYKPHPPSKPSVK